MARTTRHHAPTRQDVACDVCGRTLLRGEHAERFLAGGAAPPGLRAVHRARPARGLDPRVRRRRPRRCAARATRAARSLVERLRAPRASARARLADASAAEDASSRRPSRRRRRAEPRRDASRRRAPSREPPRASRATSARCRRTPSSRCSARSRSSTPPSTRARSAASPARSARPIVCVRPLRRAAQRRRDHRRCGSCRWYRYEVDLADEAGGVRRDAPGRRAVRAGRRGAGRQRRRRRARRAAPRLTSTDDRVPSRGCQGLASRP